MHRIGKYTASIYRDIFTASGGILAAFSISSVLLIAPSPQIIYKSLNRMCAAVLRACGLYPGAFPFVRLRLPVQSLQLLCRRRLRPLLSPYPGQARPQVLQSSSTRLRYDPVVEDDFALSVPDNIGQVGV